MNALEISVVVALFLILIIFQILRPRIKGAVGESKVAKRLKKAQGIDFKVVNDIILFTSRGSSQIDHVVVTIFGIFVIETKNYSGWIFGNERSEYWTQTIFESKTQFRNPIKQNYGHIYALKEILSEYEKITYYSIVVFSGSATLKKINSKIPVVYEEDVFKTIMDLSITPCLSLKQVSEIEKKLCDLKEKNKHSKKQHIQDVRKNIQERYSKEESLICPKCGGDLPLKNGQYGKFYGCSNYPKCKYTKNYED